MSISKILTDLCATRQSVKVKKQMQMLFTMF